MKAGNIKSCDPQGHTTCSSGDVCEMWEHKPEQWSEHSRSGGFGQSVVCSKSKNVSHSVVSNSLQPHGQEPARPLCS